MKVIETKRQRKAHKERVQRAKRIALWKSSAETCDTATGRLVPLDAPVFGFTHWRGVSHELPKGEVLVVRGISELSSLLARGDLSHDTLIVVDDVTSAVDIETQ